MNSLCCGKCEQFVSSYMFISQVSYIESQFQICPTDDDVYFFLNESVGLTPYKDLQSCMRLPPIVEKTNELCTTQYTNVNNSKDVASMLIASLIADRDPCLSGSLNVACSLYPYHKLFGCNIANNPYWGQCIAFPTSYKSIEPSTINTISSRKSLSSFQSPRILPI